MTRTTERRPKHKLSDVSNRALSPERPERSRSMRRTWLLAALVVGLASCSRSQPAIEPLYEVVLPGSEALDAGRIQPHAVRYERRNGFMSYELNLIERDGSEVYELRVFFNTEGGEPDKMYFDPATLAFLGRRLELPTYTVDVRFADNRLTGELTAPPGSDVTPASYDKPYPHGGFEPAIMNYWITALPLSEGYTASLPIFDLSAGSGMYWANIEVVGRESVEANGRTYDTWKVESRGMRKKTVWVTTTEPYAIKMITQGSFRPWTLTQVTR